MLLLLDMPVCRVFGGQGYCWQKRPISILSHNQVLNRLQIPTIFYYLHLGFYCSANTTKAITALFHVLLAAKSQWHQEFHTVYFPFSLIYCFAAPIPITLRGTNPNHSLFKSSTVQQQTSIKIYILDIQQTGLWQYYYSLHKALFWFYICKSLVPGFPLSTNQTFKKRFLCMKRVLGGGQLLEFCLLNILWLKVGHSFTC